MGVPVVRSNIRAPDFWKLPCFWLLDGACNLPFSQPCARALVVLVSVDCIRPIRKYMSELWSPRRAVASEVWGPGSQGPF